MSGEDSWIFADGGMKRFLQSETYGQKPSEQCVPMRGTAMAISFFERRNLV